MKNQVKLLNLMKEVFEDIDTSSFDIKTEFKNKRY